MKPLIKVCLQCKWAKRGTLTEPIDGIDRTTHPLMCTVPHNIGPSLIEFPTFDVPTYQCPFVLEHTINEG